MNRLIFLTAVALSATFIAEFEGAGIGGRPGGWSKVNVSRDDVQNMSLFAVSEIEKSRNSMYTLQLDSVLEASQQIVAGSQYNMTLRIVTTNCLIESRDTTQSPNPNPCVPTQYQTCNVIVLSQPWEQPPQKLTFQSCSQFTDIN